MYLLLHAGLSCLAIFRGKTGYNNICMASIFLLVQGQEWGSLIIPGSQIFSWSSDVFGLCTRLASTAAIRYDTGLPCWFISVLVFFAQEVG
jgi:hypothetical protein